MDSKNGTVEQPKAAAEATAQARAKVVLWANGYKIYNMESCSD